MCEPAESTQINAWLFQPDTLDECRSRANELARLALSKPPTDASAGGEGSAAPSAEKFACEFLEKRDSLPALADVPSENKKGHPFLDPSEEALLISFYASKLPLLVGPLAQVPRLRRESKVTATAAMFLRRFFLSNSVMHFDPKAIMVAAAFLATKVEDATTDVRYLEEGTTLMNAPVTKDEIIPNEIYLLAGINFDLLCFHPYKAVLSLTEDLRTYLKSEKGRSLVSFPNGVDRPLVGQDLKTTHDRAQQLVNDVIVSDIPLLYSPGQVGLAALIVANEDQQSDGETPSIDFNGYILQRFEGNDVSGLQARLQELSKMIRGLKEGKYGCANHVMNLESLKTIHKKLKKVKSWAAFGEKSKSKKAKRKKTEEEQEGAKRQKTSA